MADNNRMRIVVEADNKSANQAFAQTNGQMDQMALHAVKIAQSISQHFTQMAAEIKAAISGLNGAFSGMDSASRRIVDQYGRPIASNTGAPVSGAGVSAGATAGAISASMRKQVSDAQDQWTKTLQSNAKLTSARADYAATTNPMLRMAKGFGVGSAKQTADADIQEAIKKVQAVGAAARAAGMTEAQATAIGLKQQAEGAKAAAGATNQVTDSMGAGMLKAVAYFEILQQGAAILKSLTIESVQLAASTQMYGTAMHVAASANGVKSATVDALEADLKAQGITTEGARKSIMFAMTGDLNLGGMKGLAGMAKGLTVMNPEMSTSDSLQALIEAISNGQNRTLKRMGVYGLDFAHAENKYAFGQNRTKDQLLPEELTRLREAEVLRVAPKYAAMGDKGNIDPLQQALKDLALNAHNAKEAIGEGLLPVMAAMVAIASQVTGLIAANPWLAKLIGVLGVGAIGAVGGAGVGAVFGGVGAGPGALIGAGAGVLTGAMGVLYGETHKEDPGTKAAKQAVKDAAAAGNEVTQSAEEKQRIANAIKDKNDEETRKAIVSGRKTSADAAEEATTKNLEGRFAIVAQWAAKLKQLETKTDSQGNISHFRDAKIEAENARGMNIDLTGAKAKVLVDLQEESTKEYANQFEGEAKIDAAMGLRIDQMKKLGWYDDQEVQDALKLLSVFQKQTAVVEEQHKLRDELAQARINDLQGYAKIDAEMEHTISEQKRLGKWNPENEALARSIAGVQTGALGRQNSDELLQLKRDADKSLEQDQLDAINSSKEAKLASLEQGYTFDLKSKLNAEQAKYAIEIDFLNQIQDKKKEIRQGDLDDQIYDLGVKKDRGLLNETEYNAAVVQARRRSDNDINKIATDGTLKQNELLKTSTHAQREMQQQEYVQLYDKLKSSVSSVFDSMWDKNRSILGALGESLKNFFKKLASDIISTQVTKGLMGMITGQQVQTMSPGAGVMRGGLGRFSSIIGGLTGPPMIGGGQQEQQQQEQPQLWNIPGTGAGAGMGVTGWRDVGGGWSGVGNFAGNPNTTTATKNGTINPSLLDNLKGSFWNDTINMGDGSTMSPSDIGGFKGNAEGVLTSKGAASLELAGGTMLATNGLAGNDRGTGAGVFKGAIGGALMGAGIGTMIAPGIGTAIGAGVGLVAGAAAGFGEMIAGVESQQTEAKRLIRQIYGMSISNNMADQIVAIAKSKYANTVSMAVRSPEVRQLLQLYAESTGQKSNLFQNDPHGVNLTQANGKLNQSAVYHNGTGYTYASDLSTLGNPGQNMPTGNPFAGGPVSVHVSAEETQNLWASGVAQGIAGSPRQVASANVNGSTASSSRITGAGMLFNPDMVAF